MDNVRMVVLGVLLALVWQHTLVSAHVLGRPSSTSDLAQLWSLVEQFEDTLADAAQEDNFDYEESDHNQEWSMNHDAKQEPLDPERSQTQGHSRTASQKILLQDLLMAAKKRASGCFGARMDRIGNTSGLGCNSGRG
ncbi:natriuretic peptides A isoform X2 [Thalassophryne amazonica]|uniref:natriuretic peptides A isoform X2 n=1 Tax=Thalassophryne amazonica TaxID=390379 RepID=UPI0014726BAD|nr:natriuretic peptides A isoform X2 [Thalassophryne amazonica]